MLQVNLLNFNASCWFFDETYETAETTMQAIKFQGNATTQL
jgi:hypothetical protein